MSMKKDVESDAIKFSDGDYKGGRWVSADAWVNRSDIVAVEPHEDDPDEFVRVYTADGKDYLYCIEEFEDDTEQMREETEWLLAFAADRDYTSRSY